LIRDVTFDKALMVKPTNIRISELVESDATPPLPDRTISFEITPKVTQGGSHVADEDDEDQGHAICDV